MTRTSSTSAAAPSIAASAAPTAGLVVKASPASANPGTIVATASATPWRARSAVRLASRMASSDPTPNAE